MFFYCVRCYESSRTWCIATYPTFTLCRFNKLVQSLCEFFIFLVTNIK